MLNWHHLHPAVVHFPIALFCTAVGFDFAGWVWRRQKWLDRAASALHVLAVIGAGGAALTGKMAEGRLGVTSSEVKALLGEHSDWAFFTLLVFIGVLLLGLESAWRDRNSPEIRAHRLRLLTLLLGMGALWPLYETARRGASLAYVTEARILRALETEPTAAESLVKQYPDVARRMVPELWSDYLDRRVEGEKGESSLEKAMALSRAIERGFEDPSLLESTRHYQGLSEAEAGEKRLADEWLGEVESDYRAGNIDRARENARKALDIYRRLGDTWGELRVVHLQGNIAWVSGEMEIASGFYRTLAARAHDLGNREREAAALNNLAMIEEAHGNLREAAAGYRRVWTLGERHGIPRITGFALLYRGNLYHRLGMHELAVDAFEGAENTFKKRNDTRMEAIAASNRGASLHLMGAREQAVAAYERSLELRTTQRDCAPTLLHVAELNFEEGESDRALEALDTILALTEAEDEVESKRLRWGALVTAFDIHRSEGRGEAARRAIEEAESIVEETGRALDRIETSRRRAQICLDEGDIPGAVQELETAIGIVETLRTSPEAEEERIRFLAAQEFVYNDLAEIHLRHLRQPLEAFVISEQARSRAFLDSLDGRARLASDEMGMLTVVLPSSAEPEPVEKVVSSLPPDGVLFHYTVAPQWLAVLSFDREGLRSWDVLECDESVLADLVRRTTEGVSSDLAPNAEDGDESAARLAELLLEPVREALSDHSTLIIVPDGVLFGLPWAALKWEGRYLIEKHRLLIEPSASVFVRLYERVRRPAATTALLVANPTLSNGGKDLDRGATDSANVRPLPEAEAEAKEIAAHLSRSRILLGEEANEPEVRSSMGRYDIVHFGTHAWIVADRPLSSSLLLAGGDASVEEARLDPLRPSDGLLTGYEALTMELKPGAMITLAACESVGKGRRRGEGVVGLARAFFEAGAGTVVGSLWPVEDRATRELMVRFYRPLGNRSMSTAEALARAQAAMAAGQAGQKRRHPYYWAGFMLIGDGR